MIARKIARSKARNHQQTDMVEYQQVSVQRYLVSKGSAALVMKRPAVGASNVPITVDLTEQPLISAPLSKKPKAASVQSQLLVSKPGKVGHAAMYMAIVDCIHCNALPYSLVECPKFKRVLEMSATVWNDYKPPTRQEIGGDLLNANSTLHSRESASPCCKTLKLVILR